MTTTNHTETVSSGVFARRRELRLERLLAARAELARITGCQRSHDCEDDAVQSYLQQLAVERVIEEEFPDVFDAQFNTWLTEDVRAEHRGRLDPDACFLCRTFVAGRRDARPRAA